MSRLAHPTFKRGATYRRLLIVRQGDASEAVPSAVLKAVVDGEAPGDAAPALATFMVSYLPNLDPDDVASPAAFLFTLPPVETTAIPAGAYVMDARIQIGGDVVTTATERVTVEERVTEDG